MKKNILAFVLLAAVSMPAAFASADAFSYITPTTVVTTPPVILPLPVCSVSATTTAPGGRIIFTPSSPSSTPPENYTWIGETATTTTGATVFSFPYIGVYSVVLKANAWDGTYAEIGCPPITVNLSNTASSTISAPQVQVFPFQSGAAQAEIPKGPVPYTETCLNLGQDLSVGYSDSVANPADGVIYALQMFLNGQGFLKVTPTGYFGSLTTAAVKAFQKANGISATGYVGPLTRGEIKNETCLS